MKKVAFLDRDGVINHDAGYTYKIEDFVFIDDCIDALKKLQDDDFLLIIVTNQSGIARGYYSEQDYQQLTQWYVDQLAQAGVVIAAVFHCPHAPTDHCDCRKPSIGLFEQAAQQYPIDFASSLMVGDKISDMSAATSAGVGHRYLIGSDIESYVGHNNLWDCVNVHMANVQPDLNPNPASTKSNK